MSPKINELDLLIDAIKSLPGVGTKNATKWAYFLLNQDSIYITTFLNRIKTAYENIKHCSLCYNYSKNDVCNICSNTSRNRNQLCVVSTVEDLHRLDDSNNYNGLYFVLNGECNIRKPDYIPKGISLLHKYIENNPNIEEVIIATNFTINGQITSSKIVDSLQVFNLKIYRIGFGLPLNSALDYADNETIKYALMNKNKLKG